jgi:DEAD/DEAH box helicase domain-containing protein
MSREKSLEKSLEMLKDIGVKTESICAIKHFSSKEGKYEEYPKEIHPALVEALKNKGFAQLYSHQHDTWKLIQQGKNAVVVTPTASGKTLCYNLPTLDAILKNPSSRAIYLFPTKALSQDQRAELDETSKLLPQEIRLFTYDGDTPQGY